jgi:hypothetical protein
LTIDLENRPVVTGVLLAAVARTECVLPTVMGTRLPVLLSVYRPSLL